MTGIPTHTIFPISDSALTIDFGNTINEDLNNKVLSLFHTIRSNPFPGMIEAVPAYSSLTIYYDPFLLRKHIPHGQTVYNWVTGQVMQKLDSAKHNNGILHRTVTVPVCYDKEFATDIEYLARKRSISVEEIIQLHLSREYRVYMLGFMPGFSYLGEVDERIAIPRKSHPAIVTGGSVGIAGKQTGIYSLSCPGGWHIIGRTPLQLFDRSISPEETGNGNSFCLLQPGDTVKFISISKDEFANY